MPMKALILVGGFGTRLRPLTFSKPKPLVDFCNKAIVLHQIEALVKVGVDEVVLAVNYKPEAMMDALNEMAEKYGITVTCSQETEPMGTAGPLALAKEHLVDDTNSPFFVFNSDVICPYPLAELVEFHRNHGKEGTILVTEVEDPSKYGVVVSDETGKIDRFVEKPKKYVGNCINAGMYIFNPSILKRIPTKPTSIEREVFPFMAAEDELYSMKLGGYWMDIGQPKDYLTGQCLHIDSLSSKAAASEGDESKEGGSSELSGNKCIIHPTATIGEGAVLGPHVVIGENAVIGAGARIQRSAVMAGAVVKPHAYLRSTIVGWNAVVGPWARTDNVTVLGEGVTLKEGVSLNGVRVCPHKGVKADHLTEGTVIL